MNSRVSEPVSNADTHCKIEIESVLRIRPLLKKEREDVVVMEPQRAVRSDGPETVVLNPLHNSLASPVAGSSVRNRAESDSTTNNIPVEYHFNHVLPDTTNQDKIYYTLGLPIASDTMNSLKAVASSRSYASQSKKTKSHLLVCIGVSNSGKTYTCFGGTTIPKRRAASDGLVPRLLDSLFSQSKHYAGSSSKGFAVQLSMVQVTQPKGADSNACQIHDLLGFAKNSKMSDTSPKRKGNLTVRNMAARFERAIPSPVGRKNNNNNKESEELSTQLDAENPKPTIENCRDATQARELLQNGLNASEKIANGNQNFHLYISMQPVIDGTKYGDKIVILDMAGLEREKRSTNSRAATAASSSARTTRASCASRPCGTPSATPPSSTGRCSAWSPTSRPPRRRSAAAARPTSRTARLPPRSCSTSPSARAPASAASWRRRSRRASATELSRSCVARARSVRPVRRRSVRSGGRSPRRASRRAARAARPPRAASWRGRRRAACPARRPRRRAPACP